MAPNTQKIGITDVVLRDAHQSLLATRMRTEDMLPIAQALDSVGYWSLETWGGATFDACIRYLGEDPWERLRQLKKALPNTPQQMLLRGQNLLGYRHYADDVVDKFVERAAVNGMDVFRIFDAMNDPRNMSQAIKAVKKQCKHAQGTLSYTQSPVHTIDSWVTLAQQLQDMGAHSIAIKDMAGLLDPFTAAELVGRLKSTLDIPLHLHCHATTGLSIPTLMKAIEAGIDNVDTSISSMSMTYGHSPTETIAAIFKDHQRDPELNQAALVEVADYFRDVRKKYAEFEGSLRGVDARILLAQVPGGMLTNMESQLKAQGALHRFSEVLEEIPKVRKDLGYIPLVTPTSQIVGTQAVLNVLSGERFKSISKETAEILRGNYGATPGTLDASLQKQVLNGKEPITCRPADLIDDEFAKITQEVKSLATEKSFQLSSEIDEDVLIYALFAHVGLKFLQNRGNPAAFEPKPAAKATQASTSSDKPSQSANSPEEQRQSPADNGVYRVSVDGQVFEVEVITQGGTDAVNSVRPVSTQQSSKQSTAASSAVEIVTPLAGTVLKILASPGDHINSGQALIILEAMKMETEISSTTSGELKSIAVKVGDDLVVDHVIAHVSATQNQTNS